MKRRRLAWMGLIVVAMGALTASAQTARYVKLGGSGPAPYTSWDTAAGTIQAAIDVCSAGDTVWVTNGTYDVGGVTNWPAASMVTNRVAITNAITVRSANNDPGNTTIKGAVGVRGVYMANGSTLIGFTITNCTSVAANGGGMYCESTSATLSNCVIAGNTLGGAYAGGGVFQGTLWDCTLSGNRIDVAGSYGAGACSANLYNCTLINNVLPAGGGGGMLFGMASNCTFIGNYGGTAGGGAYQPTAITSCIFSNNTGGAGGGVHTCANLYNSRFIGNTAGGGGGGGVYSVTAYNCEIVGNQTDNGGGARASTLYNCTLVGNSGNTWGGGTGGGANGCTLYNCISWSNNIVDASSTPYYSSGSGYSGNDSFDADPRFLANGTGYGPSHVAGNYHVGTNSPCFNTGTNLSWMIDGSTQSKDLDGGARIRGGRVDMGAYEVALDMYVARGGNSPVAPYITWSTAASNIQDAVDAAATGDRIVVSNGTYTLTNQIVVAKGVILEGLGGSSNTFINGNYPQTTNRCFFVSNTWAVLAGFTITNGYAAGSEWGGTNGGGVYLGAGLIRDCVISSNMAVFKGGGVYLATGTITNSTVVRNSSANAGGGVSCYGNTTIRNCTIASNYSANVAGGVDVIYEAPGPTTIENCLIGHNSAPNGAGGGQCQHSATLRNCTIVGNRVDALNNVAGGMRFDAGTYVVEDCLVMNNVCAGGGAYGGGGLWMGGGSLTYLRNCTVVSNSATAAAAAGGGVYSQYGTVHAVNTIMYANVPQNYLIGSGYTLTFTNCCTTPAAPNGTGNIDANPRFVDLALGDYHLQSLSPCINHGTNQTWMTGAFDLDGMPRIRQFVVDMGAYEGYCLPGTIVTFR